MKGGAPAVALAFMSLACRDEPAPPPSAPPAVAAQPASMPAPAVATAPAPAAPQPLRVVAPSRPTSQAASVPAVTATQPVLARLEPLRHARTGAWAQYQMAGDQRMVLRVVDAEPDEVTIEVEMIASGRPLGLPARRVERRDGNRPRAHAARVRARLTVAEERVTVAGQTWEARRLDAAWTDEEIEYHRTTWLAETAPAFGILRMRQTADGRPVASMELIAFGAEDRERKP